MSFSQWRGKAAFGAAVMMATLVAAPAWAVDLKIGVVDYGRLVEESPQAKAALESIRTEFTPRQRDLQNQQASLKAKEDKLQKDAATMTQDQRANAEKDLRDSYRDLQRKQAEMQDDLNARRNEEMSRLQRALGEEVRTYAKANSYDIVLSGEVVVYAAQTYDITPGVLAAMQAHGGGAAKPAGTPSPAPAPTPAKPTK